MTTPPAVTLKPCPFCGSTNVRVMGAPDGIRNGQAVCQNCYASSAYKGAEVQVAEIWNRRAPTVIDDAMVERMCAAHHDYHHSNGWKEHHRDAQAMDRARMRAALSVMGENQ